MDNLVQYNVEFKSKLLPIVGRSDVTSDPAIIQLVFLGEMFNLDRFEQTRTLIEYLSKLEANNKRPLLVDAGANIGVASKYFNEIFPKLKIVAIEPDFENAMIAKQNLKETDHDVIEAALSSELGYLFLNTVCVRH